MASPLALAIPGLVLAGAAYGIFELPYLIGPFRHSVSISYAVGFNNSVAAASVILAFALLYLWHRLRPASIRGYAAPISAEPRATDRLGWRHWALAAGLYAGVTALIFVTIPSDYFGEQAYFMRRLYLAVAGWRPFSDFEFGYGAALIVVPTFAARALAPLGVSVKASYYLVYGAFTLLALVCVAFFVDHLRLSARRRRLVFWFVALAAYYPTMGMNGVLLRFVVAPASLVLLAKWTEGPVGARAPARVAAAAGGLALANFWVSPELGVAYWVTGALYLGLRRDRRVLAALAAHLLTLPGLFLAVPASFDMLVSAGAGGASFPVVPAPHILVYLFAVLVVAPPLLAAATRSAARLDPLTAALVVFALGCVPAALGRCDPGHVVNYGLVPFMLAFGTSGRWPRPAFSAHAVVLFLVIAVGNQAANLFIVKWDVLKAVYPHVRALADVHGVTALRWLGYSEAEAQERLKALVPAGDGEARYGRLLRYPAVGLPFPVDEDLEHYLRSRGRYAPDYYVDNLNLFRDAQLERKLRDLSALEYLLVAGGGSPTVNAAHLERWLSILFKYPVRLAIARDPLVHDARIAALVATRYERVDEVAGYHVMKRRAVP